MTPGFLFIVHKSKLCFTIIINHLKNFVLLFYFIQSSLFPYCFCYSFVVYFFTHCDISLVFIFLLKLVCFRYFSLQVWQKHKQNLILMERYHYFSSSSRQFNSNFKPLLLAKEDESETDGILYSILTVLKRVHHMFYDTVCFLLWLGMELLFSIPIILHQMNSIY